MSTTVQKGVRIPAEWVDRLHALGMKLSPHVELSEAAVLRKVVGAGLDALEVAHGLALSPGDANDQKGALPARKPKP